MLLKPVIALLMLLSSPFASAYTYPDCKNGPMAKFPICDSSAPINKRALDYVSRLNLTEKISRTYSGFGAPTPAIPRLGVPELQWINDALHGLTAGPNFQYVSGDAPFNSSTSFPSPINFAATFNDELAFELGSSIAIEARAFTNAGRGGVDLWTPNINPFRDPRWGRGQEVPGEDPYVGRRYAYQFVTGMQGGEDPRYWKAAADCKHYAAYDLENWGGVQRYAFSANVSTKELLEYYLPPFEACIRDAAAASVMCSYNALNGVPTCANDFLLQTVARELWSFDQMPGNVILSDCDAVQNIWDSHHYRSDPADAAAVALNAGCDLDCGSFYRDHLPDAFTKGLVDEKVIEKSAVRPTENLIRTGYFDPAEDQPYRQYGIEHVNSEDSYRVSYQAAVQSQVLLKNNGVLPINANKAPKIAVIGPLGNDTQSIQGNYRGKPAWVIDIVTGLSSHGASVTYLKGCDVESNNTDGFAAAVAAAKAADYTIFVGGLTDGQEAEGKDRTVLTWPGVQEDLITQLSAASSNFVVLIMGGGQIDTTKQRDSDAVDGMIWMGYPSQFGGYAVADIIYGRTSPSGRLVTTAYPADYSKVNMQDMQLRPNASTGNPGRTYMWYTGEPVFPFGFGLSYTTFEFDFLGDDKKEVAISDLIESSQRWSDNNGKPDKSAAPLIAFGCNVTNTGDRVSSVSALLFAKSTVPDTPKQQLVSYVFIQNLEPGKSKTVYFDVTMHSLAKVDEEGDRWLMNGDYELFIGHAGHSEASMTLSLTGESMIGQAWPRQQQKSQQVDDSIKFAQE